MRRKRLLIIGCGDVALRATHMLRGRYRILGLTRHAGEVEKLRAQGILPIVGDLDKRATLKRIAGIAELVLHTAPPPPAGKVDVRTRNLISALGKTRIVSWATFSYRCEILGTSPSRRGVGSLRQLSYGRYPIRVSSQGTLRRLVYISTSGVYGDCAGELVPETRPVNPRTARAGRRVDAERRLRQWGARQRVPVTLLRAPGIYAGDRLPLDRVRAGTPVLQEPEDSFTNHIHADDLARICIAAMVRGRPCRTYNASDNSGLRMGDYFDMLADRFGLPRPPRLSREEARRQLSPTLLSFMDESRRLTSDRIRRELRITLRYPTVKAFLELATVDKKGG